MGKNIQMKKYFLGKGFVNMYPNTKVEFVYDENGNNIKQFINDELLKVDNKIDEFDLTLQNAITDMNGNITSIDNKVDDLQTSVQDKFDDLDIVVGDGFKNVSDRVDDLTDYTNQLKESIISVKDFGALGNGVADDTMAIQNTIDYVRGLATGGTVHIPRGHYLISDSIRLKTNVSIKGDGKYATILEKTGDFNAIQGGKFTAVGEPSERVDYFTLRDFGIYGKGFAGDGINLQHCHYYTLENINIKDCTTGRGFSFVYSWVGTLIGLSAGYCRINYQFQQQANSINGFSLYSNMATDYGFFFQDSYNCNMVGLCHDKTAKNIVHIGSYVRALNISGLYMEAVQSELTSHMIYCYPSDYSQAISISDVNIILTQATGVGLVRPMWFRRGIQGLKLENVYIKISGSSTDKAGLILIGDGIGSGLGMIDVKVSNINVIDQTGVSTTEVIRVSNNVSNIILENVSSTKYDKDQVIAFQDDTIQRSININGKIETHTRP